MKTRLAAIAATALATSALVAGGAVASSRSTSATVGRCHTTDLVLHWTFAHGSGAGHIEIAGVYRNVSHHTCALRGFSGMLLLDRFGRAMQTHVHWGSGNPVAAEPVKTVILHPGKRASFFAGYSDVPVGSQPCPSSSYAYVTPPNATLHLLVPLAITPCGGGRVIVGPVHAGVRH
jgi:Protein of unknown function (DUF4232)